MSDTAVPARTAPTAPVAPTPPRTLDDVLLAMDVVDTLRHRERIVDMDLHAEAREAQLVARLKEIYRAQGIDVPDTILREGVKALDEQRFVYRPPDDSLQIRLARLYVSRRRWAPAAIAVAGTVAALVVGWQLLFAIPRAAEWRDMPAAIVRLSNEGQALAVDPAVDAQLQRMERAALQAVAANNRGDARAQRAALEDINARLASEYDVRLVSRPGEDTGFYRIPRDNPGGRNFYLVVEAVRPDGGLAEVPITNEETQQTERVSKWAQRVSEETFDQVKTEKEGTGIISDDILGRKVRGELEPRYDVPTPSGAITRW